MCHQTSALISTDDMEDPSLCHGNKREDRYQQPCQFQRLLLITTALNATADLSLQMLALVSDKLTRVFGCENWRAAPCGSHTPPPAPLGPPPGGARIGDQGGDSSLCLPTPIPVSRSSVAPSVSKHCPQGRRSPQAQPAQPWEPRARGHPTVVSSAWWGTVSGRSLGLGQGESGDSDTAEPGASLSAGVPLAHSRSPLQHPSLSWT